MHHFPKRGRRRWSIPKCGIPQFRWTMPIPQCGSTHSMEALPQCGSTRSKAGLSPTRRSCGFNDSKQALAALGLHADASFSYGYPCHVMPPAIILRERSILCGARRTFLVWFGDYRKVRNIQYRGASGRTKENACREWSVSHQPNNAPGLFPRRGQSRTRWQYIRRISLKTWRRKKRRRFCRGWARREERGRFVAKGAQHVMSTGCHEDIPQ